MFLISLDTLQLIFTIESLGSIQDPYSTLETPVAKAQGTIPLFFLKSSSVLNFRFLYA